MTLRIRSGIVVMLAIAISACISNRSATSIEGTVVDDRGTGLPNITVVATQETPLKGYEKCEARTTSSGHFVLRGLYPRSRYSLVPQGTHYNTRSAQLGVDTGPAGETRVLETPIILKFSPFTISGDATIVDNRTQLLWKAAPVQSMSWEDANRYVSSLGSGWRLPTVAELKTLYRFDREGEYGPLIDGVFRLSGRCCAWSSEVGRCAGTAGTHWAVHFGDGNEFCSDSPIVEINLNAALAARSSR